MPEPARMDRPDFYVLSRILERLWRENKQMLKTHLQVSTNLNYDILMKYLAWMEERGFVAFESNSGHEMVILTAKGNEAYGKLVRTMSEVLHFP
jgi:predicted transcriptional regulator